MELGRLDLQKHKWIDFKGFGYRVQMFNVQATFIAEDFGEIRFIDFGLDGQVTDRNRWPAGCHDFADIFYDSLLEVGHADMLICLKGWVVDI